MQFLLADDHALVREGIRTVLAGHFPNASVVEATCFGDVVAALTESTNYDLLLLDLVMPDAEGLDQLAHIRTLAPKPPIVVLSVREDAATIRACLERGVKGFVPKSTTGEILSRALELVLAGGVYLPPVILSTASGLAPEHLQDLPNAAAARRIGADGARLTKRQKEVLTLLLDGHSNKKIGKLLGLSEATVRTHLVVIFRLLGVSNRTQASHVAVKLGLGASSGLNPSAL